MLFSDVLLCLLARGCLEIWDYGTATGLDDSIRRDAWRMHVGMGPGDLVRDGFMARFMGLMFGQVFGCLLDVF